MLYERKGREALDYGWGVRYEAPWCTHEYPMLVSDTEAGCCYARCLRCLSTGPECPNEKDARRALLVLGVRNVADLHG